MFGTAGFVLIRPCHPLMFGKKYIFAWASFPLDFFMKLLTGVCIYRWAKIFRRAVCHPQSFADMPEILADWNKHLCSRPIQTWSSICRALTMAASWPTRRLPSPCRSSTTSWRRRWWWSSATWGTSRTNRWPASWTSSREEFQLHQNRMMNMQYECVWYIEYWWVFDICQMPFWVSDAGVKGTFQNFFVFMTKCYFILYYMYY